MNPKHGKENGLPCIHCAFLSFLFLHSTKVVRAGLLGKLSSSWATAELDASSVEDKLRERFGDFVPFLDDEDSDDPVPLVELEETDTFDDKQPASVDDQSKANPWTAFSEPLFG